MLRFSQSCSSSFSCSIPNRHRCEPSDLSERVNEVRPATSLAHSPSLEDENEDEDEHDFGGLDDPLTLRTLFRGAGAHSHPGH
jgi:hypothetical protein